MAHHKSALKRIRQSRKTRLYNRTSKKTLKEAIKSVRTAENFEVASENLKKVTKILDKVSAKKIIHKNNAANKKAKLAKLVNSLKATS
ncbi:30S ribosomal protein S20 [Bacteroidetes/Chlorobi group bacterium ChocPot_Mid]|jgi:small subunit ribosomal protein S20|nr:MAG: 30S ribosomal protein S20 [Bacteroidetes/Chlorobi group bacterium ChocPot_Mid]